jgi:predicted enzyme related to lactoylglutathione lyase
MIEGARYVHTNLIARDWRALAGFYQRVFGCSFCPGCVAGGGTKIRAPISSTTPSPER